MTTYYVYSGATGANSGTSWTDAYTTLKAATDVATSDGDVIKVHKTHLEIVTNNVTYTLSQNIAIYCVDKDNSDALSVMDSASYYIGHTSLTYYIFFNTAYRPYIYGLVFRTGSSSASNITINYSTDNGHIIFEKCYFYLSPSDSTRLIFGFNSAVQNAFTELIECTIRFSHASQYLVFYSRVRFKNCNVASAGSAPTILVGTSAYGASIVEFIGCDLSKVAGTLVASMSGRPLSVYMSDCLLNSGVTPLATQTVTNLGSAELWMYNCGSTDVHYGFYHANALGSTSISTSIYANDGATYDGTNHYSWVVASTANVSHRIPYESPWINKYHSGVSAITPYLECVRSGSATAYQNDEVWAEFSYQGTSSSPKASFSSDKMALLGTAADQASSSKGASDWTGENATSWFGKLDSGSAITPAEIGHLRARVCIGEPSTTVYVDPMIRGVN